MLTIDRISDQQDVDQVKDWLNSAAGRAVSRACRALGDYKSEHAQAWAELAAKIRECGEYYEAMAKCDS